MLLTDSKSVLVSTASSAEMTRWYSGSKMQPEGKSLSIRLVDTRKIYEVHQFEWLIRQEKTIDKKKETIILLTSKTSFKSLRASHSSGEIKIPW